MRLVDLFDVNVCEVCEGRGYVVDADGSCYIDCDACAEEHAAMRRDHDRETDALAAYREALEDDDRLVFDRELRRDGVPF